MANNELKVDVVEAEHGTMAAIKARVAEAGSRTGHGLQQLAETATAAIRKHPLIAVGAAFAIAFVAARLVRRLTT